MGRPKKIIKGEIPLEKIEPILTAENLETAENNMKDSLPEAGVELNPPTGAKKEDVVEIKKTDFDLMIRQLQSQAKDISLLLKTADKSKIAKELGKEGENLIKQCKVSTWDDTGKFVVGWKLITNRSEVVLGRWVEEQTVNVIFEDGEIITVPLLEFYRRTLQKFSGDILSRTEELNEKNEKKIMFKLQFPTGKILLIDSVYIN